MVARQYERYNIIIICGIKFSFCGYNWDVVMLFLGLVGGKNNDFSPYLSRWLLGNLVAS